MNGLLIDIRGAPALCQAPLWGVCDFILADRLSQLLEATQLAKGAPVGSQVVPASLVEAVRTPTLCCSW